MPNLTGIPGSIPRFPSVVHSLENTGASATMKKALKNCVCPAEMRNSPNTDKLVLRSANSVSDDPACSNSVQNTTLNTISTMAATIISNSALVPTRHDQIGMAMTAMRKVENSARPRIGRPWI